MKRVRYHKRDDGSIISTGMLYNGETGFVCEVDAKNQYVIKDANSLDVLATGEVGSAREAKRQIRKFLVRSGVPIEKGTRRLNLTV